MADPRGLDLQQDLKRLTIVAQRELRRTFAGQQDPAALVTTLEKVLPLLLARHRSAAAAIAADWYDEVRDQQNAAGRFRAVVPPEADPGAGALVQWAASTAQTMTSFHTLVAGGYTRRIVTSGRDVVRLSSIADPAADGWQRQGSGANCDFCNMLIGRGAVYTERTADFASHDHCNCVAVAAWTGEIRPVQPFSPSARKSTEADRARVRDWIDTHREPVPPILLGGSADWPDWLDEVSEERWEHILTRHGPGSTEGAPTFAPNTDIAAAIFDTIVHGEPVYDAEDGKVKELAVNGQLLTVTTRPSSNGNFFVVTAYPRE